MHGGGDVVYPQFLPAACRHAVGRSPYGRWAPSDGAPVRLACGYLRRPEWLFPGKRRWCALRGIRVRLAAEGIFEGELPGEWFRFPFERGAILPGRFEVGRVRLADTNIFRSELRFSHMIQLLCGKKWRCRFRRRQTGGQTVLSPRVSTWADHPDEPRADEPAPWNFGGPANMLWLGEETTSKQGDLLAHTRRVLHIA